MFTISLQTMSIIIVGASNRFDLLPADLESDLGRPSTKENNDNELETDTGHYHDPSVQSDLIGCIREQQNNQGSLRRMPFQVYAE